MARTIVRSFIWISANESKNALECLAQLSLFAYFCMSKDSNIIGLSIKQMRRMMKCAVVDDEPLALGLMESYVLKTPGLELVGKYPNAVRAFQALQKMPVDLLFLDIQMPDLSGLDLSRMIDNARTRIVFTTAFSEYALEGYKVNALDYLLKPISYPDFVGAVSRAQRWYEGQKHGDDAIQSPDEVADQDMAHSRNYIFVKSDYKLRRIDFSDILYIEGLKDYVKIYLESQPRPVVSLSSMRLMEETLPSGVFFRVHRSYIVNMDKVRELERGQILFGEKRLTISESYKDKVNDYISSHLLQGK